MVRSLFAYYIKLFDILFLFTAYCLTFEIVPSLSSAPKPATHRQKIFQNLNSCFKYSSYLLSSSVLVPSKSSIAKAVESSGQLRDVNFYEKFQYRTPTDILDYLNSCNINDGDSQKVLEALDVFSNYYPMYKLSPLKAQILINEVKRQQPKKILEIGTFFGYSALNMASVLSKGSTITCIESNIDNAKVAQMVLNKGLGESRAKQSVHIINDISTNVLTSPTQIQNLLVGQSSSSSSQSPSLLSQVPFDFIFLDHDKNSYLPDLKLLEINHLLADECTIIADNVIFPGVPDYLEYVGYRANDVINSVDSNNDEVSSGHTNSKSKALNNNISNNINSKKSNFTEDGDNAPPVYPHYYTYTYETRLEKAPFERVGFETNWEVADDAISITTGRLCSESLRLNSKENRQQRMSATTIQ